MPEIRSKMTRLQYRRPTMPVESQAEEWFICLPENICLISVPPAIVPDAAINLFLFITIVFVPYTFKYLIM
jgi:hypothetical protein